jgi:hypothetical protein
MQPTQPKKGKPVEIPVPKRSAFEGALKKLAASSRRPKK